MIKSLLVAGAISMTIAGAAVAQDVRFGIRGPEGGIVFSEERGLQFVPPRDFRDRDDRYDRLSNRELRRELRRQGWDEIRILDRDRRTVTVSAEDRRNRDRILVVNAYTGRVIDVRRDRRG